MAIEDDRAKDRQIWSGVALFWYGEAAKKNPAIGRLYHRLAILARPSTLEHLSLYTGSLTSMIPFESARGSIITLLNPILNGLETIYHKPIDEFTEINRLKFRRDGVFLAVSNFAALFEFGASISGGNHEPILHDAFVRYRPTGKVIGTAEISSDRDDWHPGDFSPYRDPKSKSVWPEPLTQEINQSNIIVSEASDLIASMFEQILTENNGQRYILNAMKTLDKAIPCAMMCYYLNHLKKHESFLAQNCSFPSGENTSSRSLPEDYTMLGQVYAQSYVPENWLSDEKEDDEERMLGQSSHDTYRTVKLHFWNITTSWFGRLTQRLLRLVTLSGRLILLASCFRCTVALPTPVKNSSTATEDGSRGSGSLPADIASLFLVLLVPGVAEMLVRLKRMSAIPVYGTLMSAMAFGWWCIRNDATTAHVLLWRYVHLKSHSNLYH